MQVVHTNFSAKASKHENSPKQTRGPPASGSVYPKKMDNSSRTFHSTEIALLWIDRYFRKDQKKGHKPQILPMDITKPIHSYGLGMRKKDLSFLAMMQSMGQNFGHYQQNKIHG